MNKALEIEAKLALDPYQGKEKGDKIKELRRELIQEFGSYSSIAPEILKGKNLRRVFRAVVDIDHLDEIEKSMEGI